jgi:hypothetical protein
LFCCGNHPSVLAFIDGRLNVIIPNEEGSFAAAEAWLPGKTQTEVRTYYELTGQLQPHNHLDPDHLVRIFWNLTPATVAVGEACFVSAVNPRFHYEDLSTLPPEVPAAMVRSWQVVEAWALTMGLTPVPFMNSGRRPASGQSVACPHAQFFAVSQTPSLFRAIRAHREIRWNGGCPICAGALRDELRIWTDPSGSIALYADPAPTRNWSQILVPVTHCATLGGVDAVAFGTGIQAAVKAWRGVLGVEPALNVLVRAGEEVGHLFAEILPRTETNVLAGFELNTHDHVISVDPAVVAEKCRSVLSSGVY